LYLVGQLNISYVRRKERLAEYTRERRPAVTTIAANFKVSTTKGKKMSYWASTIFVAFAFTAIGIADLVGVPKVVEDLVRLGYPLYFATILGSWKLLGSITIIVPGLPRLKEWAYAGMFFTLTGAAISHAMNGDPLGNTLVPLAALVAAMTSWTLQPARSSRSRSMVGMYHGVVLTRWGR
jgi:uncharacterized membrane protein YphA (DoxX/SURF4 family)